MPRDWAQLDTNPKAPVVVQRQLSQSHGRCWSTKVAEVSESLTVGSGLLVFKRPLAAAESIGLEGELNLLGAAFRLASEAPSAWVGCVGEGLDCWRAWLSCGLKVEPVP